MRYPAITKLYKGLLISEIALFGTEVAALPILLFLSTDSYRVAQIASTITIIGVLTGVIVSLVGFIMALLALRQLKNHSGRLSTAFAMMIASILFSFVFFIFDNNIFIGIVQIIISFTMYKGIFFGLGELAESHGLFKLKSDMETAYKAFRNSTLLMIVGVLFAILAMIAISHSVAMIALISFAITVGLFYFRYTMLIKEIRIADQLLNAEYMVDVDGSPPEKPEYSTEPYHNPYFGTMPDTYPVYLAAENSPDTETENSNGQ